MFANYPGNTLSLYRKNIAPNGTQALWSISSLCSSCSRHMHNVVVLAEVTVLELESKKMFCIAFEGRKQAIYGSIT